MFLKGWTRTSRTSWRYSKCLLDVFFLNLLLQRFFLVDFVVVFEAQVLHERLLTFCQNWLVRWASPQMEHLCSKWPFSEGWLVQLSATLSVCQIQGITCLLLNLVWRPYCNLRFFHFSLWPKCKAQGPWIELEKTRYHNLQHWSRKQR